MTDQDLWLEMWLRDNPHRNRIPIISEEPPYNPIFENPRENNIIPEILNESNIH